MTIYVDIDETICSYNEQKNYELAIPIPKNIEKINRLFEEGHKIIYWTSRGYISKIDYTELTKSQLIKWKCKFHFLRVGDKPNYDLLICDRTKRIEEI